MYQVLRNNRVLKSINKDGPFFSYEEARQALRKYIRKLVKAGKEARGNFGWWDNVSRNPPAYTYHGFQIRKVA